MAAFPPYVSSFSQKHENPNTTPEFITRVILQYCPYRKAPKSMSRKGYQLNNSFTLSDKLIFCESSRFVAKDMIHRAKFLRQLHALYFATYDIACLVVNFSHFMVGLNELRNHNLAKLSVDD
jgi:hypothetical protein